MQKTLDLSIKKYETGTLEGGYSVAGGTPYSSYMSNSKWALFVEDMKKNHKSAYIEYGEGSGGELKEKANRYPPKMASYGSSSRMIYNLSKELQGFCFEYKLPTTVGGIANMDGYLETDDTCFFIEAKCREPYGVKSHLIEKKYKKLYRYINDDKTNNLCIDTEDSDLKMKVRFSVDGCVFSSFDIKQMICHLLGIATRYLNSKEKKKISFLYLVYNPKLIDIIDEKKQANIYAMYDKTCVECKAIDYKSLFASIIKYFTEELNIGDVNERDVDAIVQGFEFTMCDQNDYLERLKANSRS